MANEMVPAERKKSIAAQNTQVLLIGGVLGALTGVGAAYLLLQARGKRAPEAAADETPIVSSSGLFKIGMLVFGLLRSIGDIARE